MILERYRQLLLLSNALKIDFNRFPLFRHPASASFSDFHLFRLFQIHDFHNREESPVHDLSSQ